MRLPEPMHATVPAIYRWHESRRSDPLRSHLGASVIGRECGRALWYSFRWAETAQFDGRMLRLFDTGKREELRLVEELKAVGCEVHHDDGGAQFRVSAVGGHFGGSMDAVVLGLPEAPRTWHVVEIKTANPKATASLEKLGLRAAKPQHFDQLTVYMLLAELDRGVYFSIDKATDSIYMERVELDKEHGQRLLDRARAIITAAEPPPRLSEEPDHFVCKMCEFAPICHGTEAPLVNCRTCAHSTPIVDMDGGHWSCARGHQHHDQKKGCKSDHRYIPILLERFAEAIDADGDQVEYRNKITGEKFSNGELSSAEIRACKDKAMLGQERVDPALQALREEFGATYA